MSIIVENISSEERDIILRQEEGHFLDHKALEIKPSKLTKTLSAMANADGGELYIGVDEQKAKRRAWRGFSDQEAANGHLQAIEALFPLGQNVDYTFLECESSPGLVLQIQVWKSRDIKVASDGTAYLRRGAQNLPVTTREAISRLEYAKGITSFETELLNVATDRITNSIHIIDFMLQVVPSAEPDLWLRKQELIQNGKPTVAGILLFAEEPQAILPKRCAIKIYRYKTKEAEGFREALAFTPITVEGCLYKQIRGAVDETAKIVEAVKVLGEQSLVPITYPVETLHEIITNALIHRDYSIADDIHIRIFDNRVEVESPGRLPGHITPNNILDERFARNGTIQRMLNKFPDPPNKDVGEGLNTAFSAMNKLGLKEPIVTERENSVLVIIRHEPLASPEEIIMDYLDKHPTIQNKTAREICHIPADYVVKEIFKRLVQRGMIEKVPGTRTSSTAYRKAGKRNSIDYGEQKGLFENNS